MLKCHLPLKGDSKWITVVNTDNLVGRNIMHAVIQCCHSKMKIIDSKFHVNHTFSNWIMCFKKLWCVGYCAIKILLNFILMRIL